MWFGGYLLFTFPETYEFKDFLISNFAVLFGLFGLGAAFQDISDRKAVVSNFCESRLVAIALPANTNLFVASTGEERWSHLLSFGQKVGDRPSF